MRVTASEYYAQDSLNEHRPGDVWWNLPTNGLSPAPNCIGVVITPACDLGNAKSETLTYLPLVPIKTYLGSTSFARTIKLKLRELIGVNVLAAYVPPLLAGDTLTLNGYDRSAIRACVAQQADRINKSKLPRIEAALTILEAIRLSNITSTIYSLLEELFGTKELSRLKEDIVRNNRPDTHFLPKDTNPESYAVVVEHSVLLLRYPLTIPIEIVDLLSLSEGASWKTRYDSLPYLRASLSLFAEDPPMKRGRIREAFLKDILTRYTANFGRLGSPDFTAQYVSLLCEDFKD